MISYHPGIFITFEGGEGSGKSTQSDRLIQKLRASGLEVVFSREPGGTPIGEKVRGILLDPRNTDMLGETEMWLHVAYRLQHLRTKIIPALQQGKIVVLDRYVDSSLAYQGGGRELGVQKVWAANLNAIIDPATREVVTPDLTLIYDLPVGVGLKRSRQRADLDRLELEREDFHNRVGETYLSLPTEVSLPGLNPSRFRIIHAAEKTKDELEVETRQIIYPFLIQKGYWAPLK